VHLGWQVLEQKAKRIINRSGINQMIVIQDKEQRGREGGDFIEQGCKKGVSWRRLRRLKRGQHAFANFCLKGL
jgi:hypothetical protein